MDDVSTSMIPDNPHSREIMGAFRFYRTMSYITGTSLVILFILLGLHPLFSVHQWREFGFSAVERIVGVGHGLVLYPIYFVSCFIVMLKARLPFLIVVAMWLAGFVPLLAFVMERWVARRLVPITSELSKGAS